MNKSVVSILSRTRKRLSKMSFHQVALNVSTILIVAVMLFVHDVWAAPEDIPPDASLAQGVSTGLVSYQGYLTDAGGSALDGDVNITFRLYNAPSGGTPLWTEAHTGSNALPVSDGLFNVMLGGLNPIPASVWNNSMLYLGVQVNGDPEMTPREVVSWVPYALESERALNIAKGSGTVNYGGKIPLPLYPDGTQATQDQCEFIVAPKYFSYSDSNCSDNHGIREENISIASDLTVTGKRGIMVWDNCNISQKNIGQFYYLVVCTK
jgi:hypothetical protein